MIKLKLKKYPITAEQCLNRARALYRKKSDIFLIYAALELRLAIEFKLKEFLEPYEHIPKKLKKSYKLDNLNKTVLRYLKINDQVARVTLKHPKKKSTIVLYYTPIRPALIDIGQKLGNYLHYPIKDIANLKSLLEKGFKELEFSNKGDLLGPPIGKRENGRLKSCNMNLQLRDRKNEKKFKPFTQHGDEIIMDVEYLKIIN